MESVLIRKIAVINEGAQIRPGVSLWQNIFVGNKVTIGDRFKNKILLPLCTTRLREHASSGYSSCINPTNSSGPAQV